MLTRRSLLAGTLAVFAAPPATGAQPASKMYQVGVLSIGGNAATWRAQYQPFIERLSELGYVEGRNLIIKPAFADGQAERLSALVVDLVNAKVDVIVATAGREVTTTKQATSAIPIVMWLVPDPVGERLVASLARPGGNVTGLTLLVPGVVQKYVELLHEFLPTASRFAVLASPGSLSSQSRRELESAGRLLGVTVAFVHVSGPNDFDSALARAKKDGAAGIIAPSDPVTFLGRAALTQLALKQRLPGIYWSPEYVESGGLMAYGPRLADLRRHAAIYVDKILKGAKPADLPVEQPTKFELVINLKTAKALGLTVPPSLLARADQVIE